MSTSGETADLVVKESIQITESAVKLAGLGAKNLAALLIAIAKDNPKLAGKTGLKRLIQDGEELTIFSIKQDDLKGFQMESKRYGVLFYPIVNKVEKTGTVEIMAKAKDASLFRLNQRPDDLCRGNAANPHAHQRENRNVHAGSQRGDPQIQRNKPQENQNRQNDGHNQNNALHNHTLFPLSFSRL